MFYSLPEIILPFRREPCSEMSNVAADDEETEEEEGRGEDLHKDQAQLALLQPTLLLLLSLLKCLQVFFFYNLVTSQHFVCLFILFFASPCANKYQ